MKSFKPLGDRVLILPDPVEEKTEAGIITSTANVATNTPTTGTVAAVSLGTITSDGMLHALQVRVGDRVCWIKFAGSPITVNGEPHLVMHESDLTGVIT